MELRGRPAGRPFFWTLLAEPAIEPEVGGGVRAPGLHVNQNNREENQNGIFI